MSGINWAKLVGENRAKAMGIPWSKEELDAIHNKGISVEDVRAGILNKKEVKEADKKEKEDGPDLARMKKSELIDIAKKLGVSFIEEDVIKADLILEIEKADKKAL